MLYTDLKRTLLYLCSFFFFFIVNPHNVTDDDVNNLTLGTSKTRKYGFSFLLFFHLTYSCVSLLFLISFFLSSLFLVSVHPLHFPLFSQCVSSLLYVPFLSPPFSLSPDRALEEQKTAKTTKYGYWLHGDTTSYTRYLLYFFFIIWQRFCT